jgi:glutaconate CoA-transferase subunit B
MKEEMKELKGKYTPEQLAACAGAREIKEGEFVIVGVGLSDLTGAIAKVVYTPKMVLITEAGFVDFKGISTMLSPDDPYGGTLCACHTSLTQVFSDQQRGLIDVGYISFAQVDKYGNINTTAIFGSGDYYKPEVRLQGSGGGGDISSSANRTVCVNIMKPKGMFVTRVDYMTFPGFLDGYDSRKRANLAGGGPSAVVTDRGIFRFEEESKEMYLAEVFPWQDEEDIEEIKSWVEWELKVAKDLKILDPPSPKELETMDLLDAGKTWTVPNMMERPGMKILLEEGLLEGKRTYKMYDRIGELFEPAWRKMIEKEFPI